MTIDLSQILKNERAPKEAFTQKDLVDIVKKPKRLKVPKALTKKEKVGKSNKMTVILNGLKMTIRNN